MALFVGGILGVTLVLIGLNHGEVESESRGGVMGAVESRGGNAALPHNGKIHSHHVRRI